MSDDTEQTSHSLSVPRSHSLSVRPSNAIVTRGLQDIAQFSKLARASELVELGKECFHKKEYTEAIADFNEAIRLDPTLARDLQRGFRIHSEADRETESDIFDISAPSLANAYYSRAKANEPLSTGKVFQAEYDSSIADYSEAIRLDPEFQVAYNQRGCAYYFSGDFDRAIADFTVDCRLGPHDLVGHYNRLGKLLDMDEYSLAIADITEVTRLFGTAPTANEFPLSHVYCLRGQSYFDKGEYDRAIADYSEAIRLDCVAFEHAVADFPEAIRSLGAFNLGALFYFRGNIYLKTGQRAKAESDFVESRRLGYEP
jgi:tetratricopeptide (TPR) repeat protein